MVVVCVLLFAETWREFFIYRRSEILAGEYWRLIGGHFVHVNAPHLLLNLMAWLLVWGYGLSVCGNLTWFLLLTFCSLGVGVGLFAFMPQVEWYTGLSGVLHGLLVAVVLLRLSANRGDYSAWFLLVVIAIKLSYEHFQGATPLTADLLDDLPIIFEAHWYGALSGALAAVAVVVIRFCRETRGARG